MATQLACSTSWILTLNKWLTNDVAVTSSHTHRVLSPWPLRRERALIIQLSGIQAKCERHWKQYLRRCYHFVRGPVCLSFAATTAPLVTDLAFIIDDFIPVGPSKISYCSNHMRFCSVGWEESMSDDAVATSLPVLHGPPEESKNRFEIDHSRILVRFGLVAGVTQRRSW